MHNTTLYISGESKVGISNGSIYIKNDGGEQFFYLKDLDCVVFENEKTSVSLYTMNKLTENGICVIACDAKKLPFSYILPIYGNVCTSESVTNQLKWDKALFPRVWERTVENKISSQRQLLDLMNLRYRFNESVASGDYGNAEGRFAKEYFAKLFGKEFKRHNNDSINAMLNYGYAILLSSISNIVSSHGYLTQCGFHHCGRTNRFNLCYDIIEPFRASVDCIVYRNRFEKLTNETKMKLVDVMNSEVVYKNKKYNIRHAVDLYFKETVFALEAGEVERIGDLILF